MNLDWHKRVNWVQLETGLKKYIKIMDLYAEVHLDAKWDNLIYKELRTRFNHFYRVRRNEEFQKEFYYLLLKNSGNKASFQNVFQEIKIKTGRMEASFSSKLVATIDPNKPVWDTEVLKKLNMKAPYYSEKNRELKIINCYEKIEGWYENELKSTHGKEMIRIFDEKMGPYNITHTKKIDLMLWQKDR